MPVPGNAAPAANPAGGLTAGGPWDVSGSGASPRATATDGSGAAAAAGPTSGRGCTGTGTGFTTGIAEF